MIRRLKPLNQKIQCQRRLGLAAGLISFAIKAAGGIASLYFNGAQSSLKASQNKFPAVEVAETICRYTDLKSLKEILT